MFVSSLLCQTMDASVYKCCRYNTSGTLLLFQSWIRL